MGLNRYNDIQHPIIWQNTHASTFTFHIRKLNQNLRMVEVSRWHHFSDVGEHGDDDDLVGVAVAVIKLDAVPLRF